MKKILFFFLLIIPLALGAQSRTHKVEKGQSLWGISHQYGITVDELVAANPEMKQEGYVLKIGDIVQIPAAQAPQTTASKASTAVAAQDAAPQAMPQQDVKVVLLLPLVGKNLEHQRSVEFYRGFLLGVESLKAQGKNVTILTYNEPRSTESVRPLMEEVRAECPDLIIGPVYPTHMAEVTALAAEGLCKVVVPFTSKVEQVRDMHNVFLLNTPDAYERLYGIELTLKYFTELQTARYIFLQSDKPTQSAFCATLKAKVRAAERECYDLAADYTAGSLAPYVSKGGHTLFISDSDDPSIVRKVLNTLKEVKALATGGTCSVLGYTHWLAQERALRPLLRAADSYLLTPHFYYPATSSTLRFAEKYRGYFNENISEEALRMVPLGYDCCLAVVAGVLQYGAAYSTQPHTGSPVLQTNFEFTPLSGGGYINRNIWLIHYQTDGTIKKIANH